MHCWRTHLRHTAESMMRMCARSLSTLYAFSASFRSIAAGSRMEAFIDGYPCCATGAFQLFISGECTSPLSTGLPGLKIFAPLDVELLDGQPESPVEDFRVGEPVGI